ncbi:MAG: hypothetical protein FIB02_02455, partial [Desulfuromonas sp.]|nr:hypothetical protein [Desulfuromonas sp.]
MHRILLLIILVVGILAVAAGQHMVSKNRMTEAQGFHLGLVVLGLFFIYLGLDSLYQYITYGEIWYSPKGFPTVIKDARGAYLFVSASLGGGVILATYNAIKIYKGRHHHIEPPNTYQAPGGQGVESSSREK